MMAIIIREKGEVVHHLTYCGIKEYEKSNQVHISLRNDFDNGIRKIFWPGISPGDF